MICQLKDRVKLHLRPIHLQAQVVSTWTSVDTLRSIDFFEEGEGVDVDISAEEPLKTPQLLEAASPSILLPLSVEMSPSPTKQAQERAELKIWGCPIRKRNLGQDKNKTLYHETLVFALLARFPWNTTMHRPSPQLAMTVLGYCPLTMAFARYLPVDLYFACRLCI